MVTFFSAEKFTIVFMLHVDTFLVKVNKLINFTFYQTPELSSPLKTIYYVVYQIGR